MSLCHTKTHSKRRQDMDGIGAEAQQRGMSSLRTVSRQSGLRYDRLGQEQLTLCVIGAQLLAEDSLSLEGCCMNSDRLVNRDGRSL